MNPLVQVQLNRLQHNLQALGARQAQLESDLAQAKETAESRLKLLWRHEQARATLDSNALAYEELQQRLDHAEEERQKLGEHARRIAEWSAALADTLGR